MLIEWKIDGMAHYLLADLPPDHLWDLKGMIIEARFGNTCGTDEELYALIPTLQPASTTYFRPREGLGWNTGKQMKGHYDILNMDQLLQLPRFEWNEFYHLPAAAEHGVKGAVQQSRQEGGMLQHVAPTYIPHIPDTFTVGDVWM